MNNIKFGNVYSRNNEGSTWIVISSNKYKDHSVIMYVTGKTDTFKELITHMLRKRLSVVIRESNLRLEKEYLLTHELKQIVHKL